MSDKITIKTDHKWRAPIYGYELTKKERAEFDYLSDEEIETRSFVRYRRATYDLGEFMTTHGMPEFNPLRKWHGYISDSFFSGVVIRYDQDCEQIQIGTFYS